MYIDGRQRDFFSTGAQIRGSGERKSPAGSRGGVPVGGLEAKTSGADMF